MPNLPAHTIHQLRHQLQLFIAAEGQGQEIDTQREELIHAIDTLHQRIAHASDSEAQDLEPILAEAKGKLRAIDHAIDEMEEIDDGDADSLRQKIAQLLIEKDPNKKAAHDALSTRLMQASQELRLLDELHAQCTQIEVCGHQAFKTSSGLRRGGFLRFIMGANPNKVVLRSLEGIENASKRALVLLNTTAAQAAKSSLKTVLEECLALAQSSWTHSFLAKTLPELLHSLAHEQDKLNSAMIAAKEAQIASAKAQDSWLLGLQEKLDG